VYGRARLAAARSFFRYLVDVGLIRSDPTLRLRPPKASVEHRPSALTPDEVAAVILKKASRDPRHALREVRDTALLGLTYSLGLRSSEPGLLSRDDIMLDPERGDGSWILVLRRGAKNQREPITFPLDARVREWIRLYLSALDARFGRPTAALFPRLEGPNANGEIGISPAGVATVLARRIKAAQIKARGRRLGPHVLRSSFITHQHEAGLDPYELQSLARHASIETTLHYVRLASASRIRRKSLTRLPWNRHALGDRQPDTSPAQGLRIGWAR
jgi:site-specific recombinase XerD